jgi:hypothetical protein
MKTIRITLTKEGAQATCTHIYHFTCEPQKTTWAGNRNAFMVDGRVPGFSDGIDKLERVVAFQAGLCNATYTIEDLGGEAQEWRDNIIFESDPSDSSSSPNNNNL